MKRRNSHRLATLLVIVACVFAGMLSARADAGIRLTQIADNIWVHTSYWVYQGRMTPSNGLVIATGDGPIIIDTAWTVDQTRELMAATFRMLHQKPNLVIITHAHEDRIGGIEAFIEAKVRVISTRETAELADRAGYCRPDAAIDSETMSFDISGTRFETHYPGPAHTMDNLVVYFEQEKTLYAGCIIKSLNSADLGNVADGDLYQYPRSVQNLINRYPNVRIVVPGHGDWGGPELMFHTLALAGRVKP